MAKEIDLSLLVAQKQVMSRNMNEVDNQYIGNECEITEQEDEDECEVEKTKKGRRS